MRYLLIVITIFLVAFSCSEKNYLDHFPHHKKTKYFHFYFRLNEKKVIETAKFTDQFIEIINKEFFNVDFEYPITALVLEDRGKFQDFLRKAFKIKNPPSFGIYLPKHKLFATYEGSGLGTFTHEILHPLVDKNLKKRPVWAKEGIPAFFEKFYGYWEGDQVVVSWGYQNPWRIEVLGDNLPRLDLESIIRSRNYQTKYRQSDLRIVSMFLWDHGKFKKFLKLIAAGEKNGYQTFFEAAFDKKLKDIIPLWEKYLKDVYSKRDNIKKIPPSTILRNRLEFERFMTFFGLDFKQDNTPYRLLPEK